MNILIAKVIIQDFVNKEDIVLFPDDAYNNFHDVLDHAYDCSDKEVIQALETVRDLKMIKHMFKGA